MSATPVTAHGRKRSPQFACGETARASCVADRNQMIFYDQIAARKKYRTPCVSGRGAWARVSRCGPVIIVCLFQTAEDCEAAARRGRPCMSFGCRFEHTTEPVEQLSEAEREKFLPDLGERER